MCTLGVSEGSSVAISRQWRNLMDVLIGVSGLIFSIVICRAAISIIVFDDL